MADFLDYAFAHYMVGQAAERLGAYNIVRARVDQFQHFPSKEPPFPSLVSSGNNGGSIVCQRLNPRRRVKMSAFFKFFPGGAPHPFQEPDAQVSVAGGGFLLPKFFHTEILVVEAVEQEVRQVRDNRLSPFRL